MNIRIPIRRDSNRNGVALIAVLAFLSVLIVMAVTLLISMRTERLASEAAQDDTACRLLLEGGLDMAMNDVDQALWPAANPTIRVPKVGAIFVSTTGPTNVGSAFQLLDGIEEWLPRMYRTSIDPDYNAVAKASLATWNLVRDDLNPVAADKVNIVGRVAYVCFDCTGMIDANLVSQETTGGGGPVPMARTNGTDVGEINFDYLTEAKALPLAGVEFRANRNFYHRFMTVPEIYHMNDGVDSTAYNETVAIGPDMVANLMPYSLCYDAGWWDWVTSTWKVGDYNAPGDVNGWSEANALSVFQNLGYANAQEMAYCFQDYVDTDFLPGGSSQPNASTACGEAIPMINEIRFHNGVEVSSGAPRMIRHFVVIDVELWNPAVTHNNNRTYTLSYTLPFNWVFVSAPSGNSVNPTIAGPAPAPITWTPNQQFASASITISTDWIDPGVDTRIINQRLTAVDIQLSDGGSIVDRVTGFSDDMRVPPLLIPAAAGTAEGPQTWALCNDPRINHLSSDWKKISGMDTWLQQNSTFTDFGKSQNGDMEGTNSVYVRNGPMLSVAELGYIPLGGVPWTTIDLFSSQGSELMTKFRTATLAAGTKVYANGLINPYTLFTNVLVAAFQDAPIETYPGDPAPLKVDADMASDISGGMYQPLASGAQFFDSAAGWATTRAFAVHGTLTSKSYPLNGGTGLDNNQKEAILRNTYRLFNPNQNLFTIVVVAQKVIDQPDPSTNVRGTWGSEDTVTAEKRAVALVWRDPFPDPATDRHEMFVRTIKVLDE